MNAPSCWDKVKRYGRVIKGICLFATNDNIIYDETITNVSVASSAFLIFWANKPLRWGSIGGVVALSGAIAALAIIKKRKKGVISK